MTQYKESRSCAIPAAAPDAQCCASIGGRGQPLLMHASLAFVIVQPNRNASLSTGIATSFKNAVVQIKGWTWPNLEFLEQLILLEDKSPLDSIVRVQIKHLSRRTAILCILMCPLQALLWAIFNAWVLPYTKPLSSGTANTPRVGSTPFMHIPPLDLLLIL